jgi:hypothetical protein
VSGQSGTIVELDLVDALGWIELDGGGRVRFGGTALKGFTTSPGVGSRVEVRGTKPGYKGVPKAVEVGPLITQEEAERVEQRRRAAEAAKIPWPDLVRAHPRWSDVADTCVPCARPAPRPVLPVQPLFAPWHREICETAPTCVSLVVPHYLQPEPIEPSAADCFAHGRVAFLDEPRWPSCGLCARPLRMCLQVSPAVLADFVPGGRGLAALFCFECGIVHRSDPRVGHVRLVAPEHRVIGPDAWPSEAVRHLESATQRVTPRAPRAMIPPASWLRHRSEVRPETAASVLLGYDNLRLRFAGPFPEGADPAELDHLGEAYDDWLAAQPGGAPWGGGQLGGVASWDQCDETPSCPHGEMLHLCDYEGGQFLDGALHTSSPAVRGGATSPSSPSSDAATLASLEMHRPAAQSSA